MGLTPTNGGFNLLMGNNPDSYGGGWMPLDEETHLRKYGNEVQGDMEARRRALRWMANDPLAYAKVTARRALDWMSVTPDYVPGIRLSSTSHIDSLVVRAYRQRWASGMAPVETAAFRESRSFNWRVILVWFLVMIPMACAGILMDSARCPRWILLLPLLTYATILSLTFMQHRFREIMMPVLMIYAAVGFANIWKTRSIWLSSDRRGRWILLLGLPFAFVFLVQLLRDFEIIRATL